MNTPVSVRLSALLIVIAMSGCAAYRTSSNITAEPVPATAAPVQVLISEDSLPTRKYREIAPIEVSVKKLTVFHSDPTREQADAALAEKARAIGADAVVNVSYDSGIGFTTWGYIDAAGMGVKLLD